MMELRICKQIFGLALPPCVNSTPTDRGPVRSRFTSDEPVTDRQQFFNMFKTVGWSVGPRTVRGQRTDRFDSCRSDRWEPRNGSVRVRSVKSESAITNNFCDEMKHYVGCASLLVMQSSSLSARLLETRVSKVSVLLGLEN
jgi:hypothetical protein